MTMSRFRIPVQLLAAAKRTASTVLRCVLVAGLVAVLLSCTFAEAKASDYDVEAAYLFNFGKFIHLSTGSKALRRPTFDICILGNDPIRQTISGFASKEKIDGRPVRIVRVRDASQAGTCDIVFIGAKDSDTIREDLAILSGSDVLTVGDSPEFLKDGGMIQFVERAQRVRFAVNLNAVRKTHLVLSSQLLRVAVYVKGGPQPEGAP